MAKYLENDVLNFFNQKGKKNLIASFIKYFTTV